MNAKKELAVAALENGTVIDHIPSEVVFQAVKILGLENSANAVTIGYNLSSKKLGTKAIIKVAETFFDTDMMNRIALIAPNAVVNVIKNYEVVEKRPVVLPDQLIGIARCNNPKCITNHQPMATKFNVVGRKPVVIRCHYCNHSVAGKDAKIL